MRVIVIGTSTVPGLEVAVCATLADVVSARFDNEAEVWTLTTADGGSHTAEIVIDARPSADPVIARHGVPNHFRIPGPDVGGQARYVARCLRLCERSGAARIEARGRIVLRRRLPQPVAARFYLSGSEPEPDEIYDGPATLTVDGRDVAGRVRLIGHLDAVDGRYHWQGTVFGALPEGARSRAAAARLTIADRTVPARVVEKTPWGTHMIAGSGDPPFDC